MDPVIDLTALASEFPKHQVFRDVDPFLLDSYFEQLNEIDKKLFHGTTGASINFWECFAFEEATLTNKVDLEKQLRLSGTIVKQDPICRFMFVEANYGEKLNITREMLTLILSYHQVLPSFLDFIFPFARDIYASDFHFGGFRYQIRFAEADKGLRIPDRGWSGKDLRVCYNLKSAEYNKNVGSDEWPWYMGQTAVHHSFDTESRQASWVVVKGDQHFKRRIKSATRDQSRPLCSFHSREAAFVSTLAVHLIFCQWSGQKWRWYINFLDKKVQSSTKPAVSSSMQTPIVFSGGDSAINIRQRRGRQNEQDTPHTTGALQGSLRGETAQPRPTADPRATSTTSATAFPDSRDRPLENTGFSFSDLQGTHAIEEIVNNANLLMKVNQNVLTELREAYKSFGDSSDWPDSLKLNCHGDLAQFDQRIIGIQNDMTIQQVRAEKLLRLIADRKSLLYGIFDQQKIRTSKEQAEQAQKSAWRMEEMTLTVQSLTKDMHLIARETREETISMRIMALIALLFLPGTFASTLMSTKIFQASDDREYDKALGQFFAMFLPLLIGTTLLWYLAKKWHMYTRDGTTKHEKEA